MPEKKDYMREKLLIGLTIACLTAACALNVASSKLSYGDRPAVVELPRRVGVATIVGNLAAQQDATARFSSGLVDMGFHVVATNWDMDKVLGRWSAGIDDALPEFTRRRLAELYGLEGIFVGSLSQDKGNFVDETRLSLRLISVPSGTVVWSADVHGGGVSGLDGGVKDRAISAVKKALRSLEKEMYANPKPVDQTDKKPPSVPKPDASGSMASNKDIKR